MFRAKTVFVVGAGASCELGLPSGDQLKTHISRILDIRFQDGMRMSSGDHRVMDAIRRSLVQPDGGRGNANPLIHKCWQIRDNLDAAISIDNFLDAHAGDTDLELVGKLGIVKAILDAERASKLRLREAGMGKFDSRGISDTWFRSFFRMASENVRRNQVENIFENVAFVTFNYDRCIERCLAQQLAEYYSIGDAEARNIVSRLEIHHPYGIVGDLPWHGRGVEFGDNEGADLLECSKRIKTFTEGVADGADLNAIRSLIQTAEVLAFIGFAFHPMNMELLKPEQESEAQRVFATVMGLSKSDQEEIEGDVKEILTGERYFMGGNGPSFETLDGTCAEFFAYFRRSLPAPTRE